MIKCTVELYGLAFELTGRDEITVELPEGAGIPEIAEALKKEVPALAGFVLAEEMDGLTDEQILNYDGRFYHNEDKLILTDGALVRLLTIATGG